MECLFLPARELQWSRGTDPKALIASVLLQSAIVAALMLIGVSPAVRTQITRMTLLAPAPMVREAKPVKTNRNAGGGQHSPLPPLRGALPRPAPKVYTPPLVTIAKPALVMDASLLAPPDAWASHGAIGNPLGWLDGGGGPGTRGGLGSGDGPGVGSGDGPGPGGDAGVFIAGNGVTPPSLLMQVDPEYSEEARKAKYSGAVLLSIVVNTQGRADNIKVLKSLGMGLDEKAIEAVQRWRFRPGTSNGVPVRVRAQVEVNFRLL